ncbi:universal stress protein [Alkalihalobacterium bogoriense]|uniref:universal stress protein n=1 Tax=Alkalihalobacterium bogoriense TaxID=246272 RepID=UPI00047EC415|nr:universal stress protein [Alkalihalobacterium bogoriense]
MFKHVVLAADGSTHSFRAAEKAIELLKRYESAIVDIVYVVDESTSKADVLHHNNPLEIEKNRKEKLETTIQLFKKSNIHYKVTILYGDPCKKLVNYVNESAYDCVVVGSRGLNRFQSMVLGSVSHKVAKHVQCPVLIVK